MIRTGYRTLKRMIIIVFLMISGQLPAQTPYFVKIRFSLPLEEPVFKTAIQDDNGYLWLGSSKGIYRFDGVDFVRYFPLSDTETFHVTSICQAPDGTLWIGCKDGSISFLTTEKMTSFLPEEGTAGTGISDILFDRQGVMWWSTFGEGVYYYTGNRVFNINRQDGLSDDYVYELLEDNDGNILAATDNGLSKLYIENGVKKTERMDVNSQLPDIIVRTMTKDPSGKFWLGFQDAGIGYLKDGAQQFFILETVRNWNWGPVEDILVSGDEIWAATTSEGIIEFGTHNPQEFLQWTSDSERKSFGRIFQLLHDREGNIWIISSTGIFRSTGTVLKFLQDNDNHKFGVIHSLAKDSGGDLWYSNDEGLFRHDFSNQTSERYLENLTAKNIKFMCLKEDRHGYIWTGTFEYGLFRLDPKNGNYRRITEKQGLINDNVLSITSHHDTLWMATLGGATRIILGGSSLNCPLEITSYNKESGLANTFIYDVYEDNKDRIWFATDGDGIIMLSDGKFTSFGESAGIADDVIYSVTGDDHGDVWFSTASDGIYWYDGNAFRHFGLENGLRSLEISSLAVTHGEVVIVHGLGIDVLDLASNGIFHFGSEAGIFEMAPELNAIDRDPGGNIWIGTQKGIIRYESGPPGRIPAPMASLEGMSVFLQPVKLMDNMVLGSRQNHVSFNFTGIWLSDPGKVIYRVMLEGYDIDWKNTYDKTATYSSLPPGNYVFRVMSSLDHSFAQASETSFTFRIRKPFWQSIWFIVLLGAAMGFMIYIFIKYREKKLRTVEQQKKEKVEFEFQVLKNQVNPHFLFNSFSTLLSLIEDDREQAIQYTEKLSDFFRRILQVKDMEVIPLREELELIGDYLFIQRKRYGDLIQLEISHDEKLLQSVIPPMTLQMLMENAVKHNIISKDRPLFIKIYSEAGWLIVENAYQPKRQAETSTGIGLENISRRYRLLSGKEIRIERTNEKFRIFLPLI